MLLICFHRGAVCCCAPSLVSSGNCQFCISLQRISIQESFSTASLISVRRSLFCCFCSPVLPMSVLVGRDTQVAFPFPHNLLGCEWRTSVIGLQSRRGKWQESSPNPLTVGPSGGTNKALLQRGYWLDRSRTGQAFSAGWCLGRGWSMATPWHTAYSLAPPGRVSGVFQRDDKLRSAHALPLWAILSSGGQHYPSSEPCFHLCLSGVPMQQHHPRAWHLRCWPEFLHISPMATWSQVPLETQLKLGGVSDASRSETFLSAILFQVLQRLFRSLACRK